MERPKPMDRLICGDVGFGKTEVAIRAAFKAVMDGKQVAVLVPTTVLAQQHFNTFRERMADYPMRVELLSRFRTRANRQRVVRIWRPARWTSSSARTGCAKRHRVQGPGAGGD
jgi:transcription-repair coupling factor (superfamily II helicase)